MIILTCIRHQNKLGSTQFGDKIIVVLWALNWWPPYDENGMTANCKRRRGPPVTTKMSLQANGDCHTCVWGCGTFKGFLTTTMVKMPLCGGHRPTQAMSAYVTGWR